MTTPLVDPRRAAQEFWVGRALALEGPRAVHPDTRWLGYDLWTRGMLQRWTLARLRRARSRYRRVVDLGCGYGDWTAQFATLADELYACDLSPAFVAAARQRVPSADIVCTDVRAYAIPRDFDLAYVGAVLMYVPDHDALDVLRRLRDAARPDALVVVRDFCAYGLGRGGVDTRQGYTVYRRPGELRALVERAGLRVTEMRASPSIYGEVMAGRARALAGPLRALWRIATASWLRASQTVIATADA
jgi:SAM-dependent methyltransferase